jgi:hypothetical protein
MVQLELKAKHYYLIAETLFGFAAYTSFPTLNKIKTACDGVGDDDLITVESDVDNIIQVFQILSQKPEGSYNQINGEMIDLLLPQIQAGVAANDPEWIQLGENIAFIRESNLNVIAQAIQSGKNKLYN